MLPTGFQNFAKNPNPPAPSFDGAGAAPEPSILQEIDRLQKHAQELAIMASSRVIDLQVRLTGTAPQVADQAQVSEGLRFSSDGQLGEAYHRAFQLREVLSDLHRNLDRLNKI